MSGRIQLQDIDWIGHLVDVGRPFQRQVEEWREGEARWLKLMRQADEMRENLRIKAEAVTAEAEKLWTADEIAAAKRADKEDPSKDGAQ